MNTLPDRFPVDALNLADAQKVQWFYKRYVEDWYREYRFGHFILAGYAAVPAFLTPDLLYKIWQNFNGYRWSGAAVSIHRVAVADTLLSPLCREVGFELYEMHHELRLAFLEWLQKESETPIWQQRGLRTIKEIAAFVQEYNQMPNAAGQRWGGAYTERQSLEALSYLQPEAAAYGLLKKLQEAPKKSETELLQTMDVFIKTRQRLEKLQENGPGLALFARQADLLEAWKTLIQQNSNAFVQHLNNHPVLWDLLSDVATDGLKVKLPATLPERFEVKKPATLWALIIGINKEQSGTPSSYSATDHEADAQFMQDCLKELTPPEYLNFQMLTGSAATKQAIRDALTAIARGCNEADTFLFYISADATSENGHCYAACYDTLEAKDDPSFQSYFSDAEFQTLMSPIRCRLRAAVLEMPHAGTSNWLPVDPVTNDVVIATCAGDQAPRAASAETIDGRNYSPFTYQLVQHLKSGYSKRNIRALFADTVKSFEAAPQVQRIYKTNSRSLHRPQLFTHATVLAQSLLQSSRTVGRLQTLLRQTGFYDEKTTGVWDNAADQALQAFREKAGLAESQTIQTYIPHLEAWKQKETKRNPVFLLIFCDPQKKLTYMEREVAAILEVHGRKLDGNDIEFLVLRDPARKEVTDVFKDRGNRNRIQFLYYSGFDAAGDFVLKDGAFTLFDFASLLDYQEAIHLFVSNTCRSRYFAEYASQLGVRFTVGAEDYITDDFASEFGVSLFRNLLDNKNIEFYTNTLKGHNRETTNRFHFFKAPWAQDEAAVARSEWFQKTARSQNEVYAIIIGINDYAGGKSQLKEAVNDSRKLARSFTDAGWLTPAHTTVFENEKATKSAVVKALEDCLSMASENDIVLFYFSGTASSSGSPQQIFFHDFGRSSKYLAEVQKGALSDTEFQALVKKHAPHNPSVVLIIDSNAGSRVWLDESNPKHFCLMATHRGENCLDIPGTGGALTHALVKAVDSKAFRLTYKSLYRFVFNEFLNSPVKDSQTPLFVVAPGAWNTPFLGHKTSKDDVIELQEYFTAAGYDVERSGEKGPATQKALEDFEAQYAITRGGDAGVVAALKLFLALKDKAEIQIAGIFEGRNQEQEYIRLLEETIKKHKAVFTKVIQY